MKARYHHAGPNPCQGIDSPKSRRRFAARQPAARAALRVGERRGALPPSTVTAIRLLLLTGARVSEILSLRWREVDLKAGVLNLPDSKTGRKTIMVPMPAVEILKAWPRFAKSPYVFPGEGRKHKGAHRVSLVDAWAWIRRRAKIPDVRIHDLRHSFASIAVSTNKQSLPIVGALLGHSQPATTARTRIS